MGGAQEIVPLKNTRKPQDGTVNGPNLLSGRPSPGLSGGGVLRGCSIDKDTSTKSCISCDILEDAYHCDRRCADRRRVIFARGTPEDTLEFSAPKTKARANAKKVHLS